MVVRAIHSLSRHFTVFPRAFHGLQFCPKTARNTHHVQRVLSERMQTQEERACEMGGGVLDELAASANALLK
eukprot:3609530-Alexandrium_andersonii.AAC.1